MQGQNVVVYIYRATQGVDDVAGGATRTPYVLFAQGRGRVQQRSVGLAMRAQGLTTDKLFDAFYQPATDAVVSTDMLIPQAGPFANERFYVTAVQKASMVPLSGPRAHIKLQLERWDEGRMIDLQ